MQIKSLCSLPGTLVGDAAQLRLVYFDIKIIYLCCTLLYRLLYHCRSNPNQCLFVEG